MALYVDIEKRLGTFDLKMKFEMGDEVLALLGASGSGKSTLLKLLTPPITPHGYMNGKILFDGKDVVSASETLSEDEQKQMVRYLKALIQQYVSRMIEDHLTVDDIDK